ncbi:MAG TPA: hypothetical protein VF669_13915 [Tepidisphaeraceae bacterium]|jgi:hypothetical protein
MAKHATLITLGLIALIGCQHQQRPARQTRVEHTVDTPVPSQQTAAEAQSANPQVYRTRAETLEAYANQITTAPDRAAQAAAIRALWQHLRDNNYTYQVQATRLTDNASVLSPATVADPLRVNMSIFQADQRLYDFSFQPMNNQDIGFMTQGGT